MKKTLFDVVVLGSSINGKYALSEINRNKPDLKVGIVDSKNVLQELITKTEVTSNIQYSGHNKRNSINSDKYERWGGALMLWPESQAFNNIQNLFDINTKEFNLYENEILSIFGLEEKWLKKIKPTEKLKDKYIINTAFVTKNLTLNNLAKSAEVFDDLIIFKIIDKKTHLVLIGYDFINNKDIEIKSKKLILAAGAIENARVLLNSSSLHIKNLGQNLSDHVNTDIYKFKSSSLPENLTRYFENNSEFWPRLQNTNRFSGDDNTFFGHISKIKKTFLPKENLLFKDERSTKYNFSLFYEKKADKNNYISASKPVDEILPINIHFNLSDQDIQQFTLMKNNMFDFFKNNYPIEKHNFDKDFLPVDFTDTLHPSGVTSYNRHPNKSVVSKNGNLIINENIVVLGTSNFPRPFSIHPTLASLALTKHIILNNF